jgi:hypothetical protein
MGAELWYHQAPWDPDPEVALRSLQARFVAEHYDLRKLLSDHLGGAREAVAIVERERRSEDLLGFHRRNLQVLERLSAQPVPADPAGQIDIIRKIEAFSGQGVGNVLDVERVSDQRDYPSAERLSEAKLLQLVGTSRPTAKQGHEAVYRINEELHRGEAVCFPIYNEAGVEPVGWYFVGNTID